MCFSSFCLSEGFADCNMLVYINNISCPTGKILSIVMFCYYDALNTYQDLLSHEGHLRHEDEEYPIDSPESFLERCDIS